MKTAYTLAKELAAQYKVDVVEDPEIINQYTDGEEVSSYLPYFKAILIHPVYQGNDKVFQLLHELGHHVLFEQHDEDQIASYNAMVSRILGHKKWKYQQERDTVLRTEYKAWDKAIEFAIALESMGANIDIDCMIQYGEDCLDSYYKFYKDFDTIMDQKR